MVRWVRRGAEQGGQAATEFLGVFVVIVAVIVAIVFANPNAAEIARSGSDSTVCDIVNDGCDGGLPQGRGSPGNPDVPSAAAPGESGGEVDADGDGVPDADDPDDDNDGEPDGRTPEGRADAPDADGDGLPDESVPAADGGDEGSGGDDDGGGLFGGLVSVVGDAVGGARTLAGEALGRAGTLYGAYLDGLVRGDLNTDDRTGDWATEAFRAVGQLASSVIVVGDLRDAGAALIEIGNSGGRDGWGNLVWSAVGLVPLVGDLAKGARGANGVWDVFRAADDVPRPRAADDVPQRPTCLTNSFTPGTGVLLADGSTLPIAQVDVGDRVLAADPSTGAVGARPVTALIVGSGVKELVDVTVAGATLTATDGHPFWLPDVDRWVDAEDLQPGDDLLTAAGDRTEVLAVAERTATATVHNLTVADLHTYHVLAGAEPVLVHNADCTPDGQVPGTYEASPKHGPEQRGRANPAPTNGQAALERSVQIKDTSARRVGVDHQNGEFVVFDETHPGQGIYHGHTRSWSELTQEMRNTLIRQGLADRRGRMIPPR